jgi:hypothetical protein
MVEEEDASGRVAAVYGAALRDAPAAGIADAGPGMATILRAYAQTLSRVLVLVASSAGDAGDS